MSRTSFALILIACVAALTAAACSLDPRNGGAPTVEIPDTYRTSNPTYTLLYSTLGYEAAATKRVLIRLNDVDAPVSEGLAFQWRLIDANGKRAAAGQAAYEGTAWGIPLWSADFSDFNQPGVYRMMFDGPEVTLATEAFPVGEFVMFKTAYTSIALENAEARGAPIELDNGFFDTNSRTGTVVAHASFLVGLLETYDRRHTALTEEQRTRTREAIDRALEYLLLLSDPGSGRFANQAGVRPYQTDSPDGTAAGLRALAHYAAIFQMEEPERAQRAFRRATQARNWLLDNAPQSYPDTLRAIVSYDLYRFAGDNESLLDARQAVREIAADYDLRAMDRESDDTLPHFEAMYRLWRDFPIDTERGFWEETAKRVAAQYNDMIERNVFRVIPPGTTDEDLATSAEAQWDGVAAEPPPGEGISAIIGNDWFMARAIDATYLASIAGDPQLEQVATASLQWITGLNPGVPAGRVTFSGNGSRYEAASFLTGMDGRAVRGWSLWEWMRPKPFATIVHGFQRAFSFDDNDTAGESSLLHDGIWLYATTIYEDYVNAGERAPNPDPRPESDPGMHVASTTASERDGALHLLVSVAGPDGSPLPATTVVVAFSGTPLDDLAPESALRVLDCITDAGGSCEVVLPVNDLPAQRPIAAAVTNVVHPLFDYDIASDSASRAVMFP